MPLIDTVRCSRRLESRGVTRDGETIDEDMLILLEAVVNAWIERSRHLEYTSGAGNGAP